LIVLFLPACSNRNNSNPGINKIKIAVIYYAPEPAVEILIQGLINGLKEFGYEQNKNIDITFKHCAGDVTALPPIMLETDALEYDLAVPLSTPCLVSAIKNLKKTPIIFSYVSDPLAAGAGKSYTDHPSNITGVGSFDPYKESIDLILSLFPNTQSIGTIYNSSEINSQKVIEAVRNYCAEKKIKLEEITVVSSNDISQAIQSLVIKKIDVFYGFSDNTLTTGFDAVIKTTEKYNIPVVSNVAEYIDSGPLAAIGFGWYKVGVRTSAKIRSYLTGTKISAIPIENYSEPVISINKNQAERFKVRQGE
ncbi:MAG TPA: ABC transporter substrate-binding protein, partial [bacterium]|nr:ABC transporter substrate-binding protein [bacterium]